MRFRAQLLDADTLNRILKSLEKVDDTLIFHVQPEKLNIIARNDSSELGLQAFTQIKADTAFCDFQVDSRAENNIYFKAGISNMLCALKSASQNTADVLMKLTKKPVPSSEAARPFLTFEICREATTLVHDVPIQMMNAADMNEYQEPEMSQATVEVYLPAIKMFKAVIDRLKTLATHVTMQASMAGELVITAEPMALDAQITFTGLRVTNSDTLETDATAMIKIDLKKISRVLFGHLMQSNDIIACFHPTALVLHFLQSAHFTSYYLPLVALD